MRRMHVHYLMSKLRQLLKVRIDTAQKVKPVNDLLEKANNLRNVQRLAP